MKLEDVFLADGRLRSIWRFFLSLILIFAVFVVASELRRTVFLLLKVHPGLVETACWQSLMVLAGIIGAFKLLTVSFERRPVGSVGLAFHPRWWRELGHGLGAGAAMLALAVALEWACGFARFTFVPHLELRAAAFTFGMFAVAAANEEAIFRGYPFQRLVESITPAGAVILTSALFGLAHLANPHRTWISTLNTALVGIPFCIAYLRTRALWLPIGMHFAWNFLLSFVLGLPVSGFTLPDSLLTARVGGPAWLTGGAYGPEGGLLATGAILFVTVYLSLAPGIYMSEEMKALVFAPAALQRAEPPISILPGSPDEGARKD